MTPLVFLDIESTGLDFMLHDVVEVAWAVGDGDVNSFVMPHTLQNAEPKALEINGYYSRRLYEKMMVHPAVLPTFAQELTGATIVGSNPAFDTAFLRRKIGFFPWHHRLINVAEGGMWVFGWDRPKGLADVAAELGKRGYHIPEPDHTAAGDVRCTRDVYHALREIRAMS